MNSFLNSIPCRVVLFGMACLSVSTLSAHAGDEADAKWQVRFSGNTLFNVSASFKGNPQKPQLAGSQDQPGAANYDNGYVGKDISGDPNYSTYWGYKQTSQQIISGGNVTGLNFERTSPVAGAASPTMDADPSFGGEITLRRQLANWGKARVGLELGGSYNRVDIKDTSRYMNSGQRAGSAYNLPEPVDASLFPPGGYQGPYNGAGPVINPNSTPGPAGRVPDAVTVTGLREVEADLFGFRLGPYIELPITKKLTASFSGGGLLVVVHDSVTWNQTLAVDTATTTGYWKGTTTASDNSTGVTAGFYLGGELSYALSKDWSLIGGIRFQDAGTYTHHMANGQMDLNLGRTYSVNLGVGYSF